jgi:LysR family nitrogen assimilation transcriptional regulator
LFTEYLSVYGAPQVGDPASATCRLSLFSGVPLVLPGRSNGLRMLMDRAFAQSHLELNVVADLDSLPAMLELRRSLARTGCSARGRHQPTPSR